MMLPSSVSSRESLSCSRHEQTTSRAYFTCAHHAAVKCTFRKHSAVDILCTSAESLQKRSLFEESPISMALSRENGTKYFVSSLSVR